MRVSEQKLLDIVDNNEWMTDHDTEWLDVSNMEEFRQLVRESLGIADIDIGTFGKNIIEAWNDGLGTKCRLTNDINLFSYISSLADCAPFFCSSM